MTKRSRNSDSRTTIGGLLTILSQIGFFVGFLAVVKDLIPPAEPIALRVAICFLLAFTALVLACVALRTKSPLWQIPLGAFALAAVVMGVRVLITALLNDWHLLLGKTGVVGATCLLAGIAAGGLMKLLQARLLPQQDA